MIYDFKKDLKKGKQCEHMVADMLRECGYKVELTENCYNPDGDLIVEGKMVEVKEDTKALTTGNFFLEFQQHNPDGTVKNSGISATKSEWYAIVIPGSCIYWARTEALRDLASMCRISSTRTTNGQHYTSKGYLVPLNKLEMISITWNLLRKAV